PGENGPLYVILLRLWIGVAGQSETALRLSSAIPAALCVPAIYLLGRRLFDHRSGLVCALLLACSSYQLFYAQMVKMYALVLLLSLLSGWLLVEGIERPRWRTWGAYTAITTALMFTHIFGAMVVPWHVIVAVVNLRRTFVAPALVSLAMLTLPYLPLALLRLAALRAPETLNRQFTGPRDLMGMLATLAREYGTRFDLISLPILGALFLGFTLLGLAALLGSSRRRLNPGGAARLRNSFLVAGLVVPLLITFGFVSLGAPVFSSRYLIVVLPVFYLLWGAGISWTPAWRRLPAVALLLLFIGLNAARWSESVFQGKRFREDWRGAVERLRPALGTADRVVVLHDPSWRAVHYYAGDGWPMVSLEGGPERPADLSRFP
ncbi:MAG: glycosyltransferase family 39 protein, partial [Chloroflexota bacterium]